MAGLVLYGSSVADSTLTSACQMVASSGGSETSKASVGSTASGNANFFEVWSKGNANIPLVSSIPSTPGENGWVYPVGAGTFATGNWSAKMTISTSDNLAGNHTIRFFRYTPGTGFTHIGDLVFEPNVTAKHTYTVAAVSMASIDFLAGDFLCVDYWFQSTYGAGGARCTVYESTGATAGVANDVQITTSDFSRPVSLTLECDGVGTCTGNPTFSYDLGAAECDGIGTFTGYLGTGAFAGEIVGVATISCEPLILIIDPALTTYGSAYPATTVTTAGKLYAATGGTAANLSTRVGTSTQYKQIWSRGTTTTQTGVSSIPAPTGSNWHGWIWDVTTLDNAVINAGTWTPTIRLLASTGTTVTPTVQWFKRSSAGVFTSIGSVTGSSIALTTSLQTLTFSPPSLSSVTFAAGDKLCMWLWVNQTAGGGSNSSISVAETSATSTAGTDSGVQVVTPGYYLTAVSLGITLAGHGTFAATLSVPRFVLYGTATPDSTFTTAGAMSASAGGVETSKLTTYSSTSGNFGEVYGLGATNIACVSTIPTNPTMHGWVYTPGAGTVTAGNWSAVATMASVGNSGNWTLRFFKRDTGGTFTAIATLTKSITSTAKTTYTFPAAAGTETVFAATDTLVIDLWYEDTYGAGSEDATVYEGTSGGAGVVNDMYITSPIFAAAGGGGTQTITVATVSAAVQALGVTRTTSSVSTAVKALGLTRTAGTVSVAVKALGLTRTAGTVSTALQAVGLTRTAGTVSAALQAVGVQRTIGTVSAVVAVTNTRTAASVSVALQQTGMTRTAGTVSASVSVVQQRSASSLSVALQQLGVTRSLVTVSVALQQTGITRTAGTVSASVTVGLVTQTRTVSSVSASLLFTGERDVLTLSTAVQALGVTRTLSTVSAAVGQGAITRTVSSVSTALQALGVARTLGSMSAAASASNVTRTIGSMSASVGQGGITRSVASVSAALQAVGLTRTAATVSTSLALTTPRTVGTISVALQALGLTRTAGTVSASVATTKTRTAATISTALKATVSRDVAAVSSALKALGVQRTLSGVAAAVGQGAIVRTAGTVSVAVQALGIARTCASVSVAVQQTGVPRSLTGVSTALKTVGVTRSLISVSGAVSLTSTRTLTGVTAAVQMTLTRPIASISTSVIATKTRNVVTVSGAMKAIGVTRNITGVVAAIGVFGMERHLTDVSASVSFAGKTYTHIQVGSPRGSVMVSSPRGTIQTVSPRGYILIRRRKEEA